MPTIKTRDNPLLRRVQTGRLQWYALVLFSAVGLFSLALVIFS